MAVAKESMTIPDIGPFDGMRDYIMALEARGRVKRIPEIDQDKYEATALAYRMVDRFGTDSAPALLIERVKIGGDWREGPIVCNPYGSWADEALTFGAEIASEDEQILYRSVIKELGKRLDSGGQWNRIEPVTLDVASAPCKQVIVTGDAIDVTQYPWFKNNPADASRYINMGSVFLYDEEIGPNVGTYRSMVHGKNRIGVNPEPGQHGWLLLNAKRRRGEKFAHCSIAVGPDPITFAVSSNKMAALGEDEMLIAGGLRGKPVEMVKSETNDLLVPAHAEMIIEGIIPLDQGMDEGPYGEMYGYMGPKKPDNFFLEIQAITHRRNPWFINSFTGVTNDMPKAPFVAAGFFQFKKTIPHLTGYYIPPGANGTTVISIDKTMVGQGIQAGQTVSANPGGAKVVIVVDKDINILDPQRVLHALGARWQPSAHIYIPQTFQRAPDPSLPRRGVTSKMVIDATQQLPGEGGPESWPPVARTMLEEQAPESFAAIDKNWSKYFGPG